MTPLQEALAPKSDQLNADDLISGPRILKITGARFIEGDRGGKKIVIHFDGDNGKPWKPCKTMGRAMVIAWGIVDYPDPEKVSEQFAGKSVEVFRDPEVAFGDQGKIGGVRISHMSHIDKPAIMKLTVSQGKKSSFTFLPLIAEVREIKPTADPVAKYVAAYIASVEGAADTAALDTFVASKSAKLDELREKRPEMNADCLAAVVRRRAELEADAWGDDEAGGEDG